MRNINIGDNQFPQPQFTNPEPQQPVNNEPGKPNNKHALIFFLAIPFIIGALLLGNYLLGKSSSFFKDKRNEIMQKRIDEHVKEKEEENKEKGDYIFSVINTLLDDTKIILAANEKDSDIFFNKIDSYSGTMLDLYINGRSTEISGTEPIYPSETEDDLENYIINIRRIKKVDEHYYIIDFDNEKYIYYKIGESKDENNKSFWVGLLFIIRDTSVDTDFEKIIKEYKNYFKVYTYKDSKIDFLKTHLTNEELKKVKNENGKTKDITSYTNLEQLIIKEMEKSGISIRNEDLFETSIFKKGYYAVHLERESHIEIFDMEIVSTANITDESKGFRINGYQAVATKNYSATAANNIDVYVYNENKIYMFSQVSDSLDGAINTFNNYFSK